MCQVVLACNCELIFKHTIVNGDRIALLSNSSKLKVFCLTLGSSTVVCTVQTLYKPPQRRQGPDLRPLWLLVGTPSAIEPELAFSRAEHSLPYSDVTIYIFAISYLSSMLYVYRFLWPLRLGWLLVWCLYKEVYLQIFKCVSFWLHGCCGEWEGGARKPG